jgi:putative ABC transport system permease protein
LAAGRFFTQRDVDGAAKVCVIGQTVDQELFGNLDPLGKIIRIRKVPFRVIGVLAPKGLSPGGQDQDDVIHIPVTTALSRLFGQALPRVVRIIMVKAQRDEAMKAAESQISALLRQRHRIGPNQENDFSIRNLSEMMEAAEQSTRVMSLLLGAIASVSLLVGGIGIMNIMLVSVTERTREIGIRMAVGAREGDILMQFLIEAVLLSLGGGVIGILLGMAVAHVISSLLSWPVLASPGAVALAFSFSAAVGLFFGLYPARRASLLDPIEALRHE